MELNRSRKPQPKGKIAFTLPEIEKFRLNNNLSILFVQKDNLPIIQFTLLSDAGSRFDPHEKKGISNLLASVIDEGAGGMDSLELNDRIESLGSSMSIFSDPDSFFISMMTLSENLDKSLDLFSKIITKPHLLKADFDREKRKVITRIQQSKDDPAYVASVVYERLIYGEKSPYGLPDTGTAETVERITPEDLKLFYETLLTPENSTLVIVGSYDKYMLLEKLNAALAAWHTYDPPIFEINKTEALNTRIYFVHKEEAAQSEVRIGHITGSRNSEDFFAKAVMNNILGGQFSSRINLNLRENKGYTYGAHSSFSYNKICGYFGAGAAVKNENTGASIAEIIKELNGIKTYITEKEIRFAKSSMIRKYPSLFETYGQIGRSLANMVIHSLPEDYFNRYIDNIKNVTLEDAYKAAKENIFTDKLVILVVGERDSVLPQLRDLNISEVIELDKDGALIKGGN